MRPRPRAPLLALAAALSALGALSGGAACSGFREAPLAPGDGGPDGAGDAPDETAPSGDAGSDAPSPFTVVQGMPAGEALTAIWGASATEVFAVGTNGVKYELAQGQWSRDQTQLGRDYQGIWGTSASNIYAVGVIDSSNQGIVEHYDGTQWTDMWIAPTPLFGVWGTAGAVIVVGGEGTVYGWAPSVPSWQLIVDDGGLSPNPNVPASPGEPILWGIAGKSATDFAMPADRDMVIHQTGEGDFEHLEPTVDRTVSFRSIFGVSGASESYFLGTNYFGVVWLTDVGPPDAAALDDNMYSIFQDHTLSNAEQLFIYGIWGTASRFVFTGDLGHIYTYSAAADKFGPVPSPVEDTLYAVWGSSASDVWIVGQRELILHGSLPSQ